MKNGRSRVKMSKNAESSFSIIKKIVHSLDNIQSIFEC